MRVLAWHEHGSWMTSFVEAMDRAGHQTMIPVLPDRGPDGRGRAQTWNWPASAIELTMAELGDADIDVMVLQRPKELLLAHSWTGRQPGTEVPAVYVEHNAPTGHAADTRQVLADRSDIPIVHVTAYNALMWDSGSAPTVVIPHGIPDPGYLYTGERKRIAAVINEPLRRGRVTGTDLVLSLATHVPVEVYGMRTGDLAAVEPSLAGHLHDLPQAQMHRAMATGRAYFHPYRWTSLGLSLIEAMALGMPVLAVAGTEAPSAIPADAGIVSADPVVLREAARTALADPDQARDWGLAARRHALTHFSLDRFSANWQQLLKEVVG
jgi:glycosyltransferase involved in cell wall biosynthesis